VLTGPKIRQQLQENLSDLRGKGPLSEEENGWIRDFGQSVLFLKEKNHGNIKMPAQKTGPRARKLSGQGS
jgi:hypothetical protein